MRARIRRRNSLRSTSCAVPESISESLRMISASHAFSTSGSGGPSRLATRLYASSARSASERFSVSERTFSSAVPLIYVLHLRAGGDCVQDKSPARHARLRSGALPRARKQRVVPRPAEPLQTLAVGEHDRDAPRFTRLDEGAHAIGGVDVVFPVGDALLGQVALCLL